MQVEKYPSARDVGDKYREVQDNLTGKPANSCGHGRYHSPTERAFVASRPEAWPFLYFTSQRPFFSVRSIEWLPGSFFLCLCDSHKRCQPSAGLVDRRSEANPTAPERHLAHCRSGRISSAGTPGGLREHDDRSAPMKVATVVSQFVYGKRASFVDPAQRPDTNQQARPARPPLIADTKSHGRFGVVDRSTAGISSQGEDCAYQNTSAVAVNAPQPA